MNCLLDYIGISGCEVSGSELLINSLPAISLASINGLTSIEQSTYIDIWNNVQQRALKRYTNDITRLLSKRYRLKQVKKQIDFGSLTETGINTEVEYQGLYFDFRTYNDYLTVSNLAKLYVQNIRYYGTAGSVGDVATIEIIQVHNESNLAQEVVYSTTHTTTAGWNTVTVEQGFDINNYIISVRGLTETAKMPVQNSWSTLLYSCFNGRCFDVCPPLVKAAIATTSGNNIVITTGQDSYGVTGSFSIVCSYENVVCNNKALFGNPLWYLCGVEMMVERMHSDKLNQWTLNDEKAQSLHDYYLQQYNEQLDTLIQGITLDLTDSCIECNQQYRMVEMMP